jgi:hypothetical protein
MAESSSAVPSSAAYDVFLNHRGPDVKKSFASHLYRRLLSYGLRVFLDQPELHRGDYFTPQIEDAIRSASVHVAIFSVGYVDSIWCLNELVQMLDSKAPIIPVFYHVKPTELRRTRGRKTRYAEALEKHERKTDEYNPQTPRYDSSTIENWRNVLSKVADISGFELEACNG